MNVPKLRTFVEFKNTIQTEMHVTSILNFITKRSILAQFRCGMLHLNIETPISRNPSRISSKSIHFLLHSQRYTNLRWDLFQLAQIVFRTFIFKRNEGKLNMVMSDEIVNNTAKYLQKVF